MFVNGVDGLLPFLDGTEMLIEESQVKWLGSTNRQLLVLPRGGRKKPTEYESAPHGWLIKGEPAI